MPFSRLSLRPGRPAVGAADRGLEAVAERGLVAVEVGQLVVADRRGRAEERLGRDAGELGEGLVGERRVGDDLAVDLEPDGALLAAERLHDGTRLRAGAVVVVVDLELDPR